jgi:protein gp37
MSISSKIEWTQATWNPTTGCTKTSLGCQNCYAETLFRRFESQWGRFSEVRLHRERLVLPEKRRVPTVFFVNSMSDLFHESVPDAFIEEVFRVMNACPHHIFQILTKRPERLEQIGKKLNWTPNIWLGVTIESKEYVRRADHLRHVPAKVRFVSFEPLLGSIQKVNLKSVDWIIVGGESGRKPRAMQREWVVQLHRKARQNGIPFFFKQWGGTNKKKAGAALDGREYRQMPVGFAPKKVGA